MTNVAFTPLNDGYCFECTGHACFAPKGSDIVCAAASALCCTLILRLDEMQSEGLVKIVSTHIADGEVYAEFNFTDRCFSKLCVESTVKTIEAGFEALSKSYPDNVSAG